MKNISALIVGRWIALCIIFSGPVLMAQNSDLLPGHISVSFNGKFVNELNNYIDQSASDNGVYVANYEIGAVTDENRELKNFRLYRNNALAFQKQRLPGADFYLSNAGYVAVMDMDRHFMQELTIHIFNPEGVKVITQSYRYASVFGFSPTGKQFVVGTDRYLEVINCETQSTWQADRCSQFAFSGDEAYLATAFEDEITLYKNGTKLSTAKTGLFYPRGIAISLAESTVGIIGKKSLKTFSIDNLKPRGESGLGEHLSYRDIRCIDGKILAGVHWRHDGISKGLLYSYTENGENAAIKEIAARSFPTFETRYKPAKNSMNYETIPWPFVPFDEVHKVWNHYEQHMGDGTGYWAYLHQGLDLETPIAEPTYAVQPGIVKCVLTLGGDIYWRLAVSPEQSSGYSDGWLYAHLIPGSIQVDVGDEVQLHDYLGDIIAWTSDWGHIHFVNIHDQGSIWYYNDDEWGINFNPLLALDPITDAVAPQIDDFSASSKFGFCVNQGTTFLDPMNLSGEVDIIARISDFYGDSEWEQPAFVTYYRLNKLPENTTVVPKTLGQILNHSYPMYNSGFYESYAPILYYRDDAHPSPPWMNFTRDYYQILTNNNGDSIIDLSEANLAFNTAEFDDGMYRLFVEAWDEFGNMAIDSQDIVFDNFNTGIDEFQDPAQTAHCVPNPATGKASIHLPEEHIGKILQLRIYDGTLKRVLEKSQAPGKASGEIHFDAGTLKPGIYLFELTTEELQYTGKFIKN